MRAPRHARTHTYPYNRQEVGWLCEWISALRISDLQDYLGKFYIEGDWRCPLCSSRLHVGLARPSVPKVACEQQQASGRGHEGALTPPTRRREGWTGDPVTAPPPSALKVPIHRNSQVCVCGGRSGRDLGLVVQPYTFTPFVRKVFQLFPRALGQGQSSTLAESPGPSWGPGKESARP